MANIVDGRLLSANRSRTKSVNTGKIVAASKDTPRESATPHVTAIATAGALPEAKDEKAESFASLLERATSESRSTEILSARLSSHP
jgi:ribosomal protein L30E